MAQRAAIVTGGSSGIGLGIARVLGEEGYGLTVAARRPEKLEEAAEGLRADGFDVNAVSGNLGDEGVVQEVVRFGAVVPDDVEMRARLSGSIFGRGMDTWGRLATAANQSSEIRKSRGLRASSAISGSSVMTKSGFSSGSIMVRITER